MPDDFRVSAGFFDHPKTRKLEYRAGEVATLCFLRLWKFCAVTPGRCSGDLSGMDIEDVEIASGWKGDAGEFVKALVGVGYLDGDEGGWSIHDFEEHQPFVASGTRRSENARFASLTRWHKNGRHAGAPAEGCPLCFPQCDSHAVASDPQCGSHDSGCGSALSGSPDPDSDPGSDPGSGSPPERDPDHAYRNMFELEAAGYRKYGSIIGDSIAAMRNLLPVYQHELDAALSTNGRRWNYAAQVIENYREKAQRAVAKGQATPPARRNRPPTREELAAITFDDDEDEECPV
jgi:hypothetical protein